MTDERFEDDEPCYVISIAARLVRLHPQTLRYYDRIGLIRPSRSQGRMRLYSQRDVDALRKVARLTEDLGVNLAGVEVILNMARRIEELQQQLGELQEQAAQESSALRQRIRELEQFRKEERSIIRVVPRSLESRSGNADVPTQKEGMP